MENLGKPSCANHQFFGLDGSSYHILLKKYQRSSVKKVQKHDDRFHLCLDERKVSVKNLQTCNKFMKITLKFPFIITFHFIFIFLFILCPPKSTPQGVCKYQTVSFVNQFLTD